MSHAYMQTFICQNLIVDSSVFFIAWHVYVNDSVNLQPISRQKLVQRKSVSFIRR